MRLVVFGSRGFDDEMLMGDILDVRMNRYHGELTVVSGMARGADLLAFEWAKLRGVDCVEMPALWDQLGKRAGFIRNHHMAQVADAALGFWDGKSRGTMHMIDIMGQYGKPVEIVRF